MIDCSKEMKSYFEDDVALSSAARTQMRDHRARTGRPCATV